MLVTLDSFTPKHPAGFVVLEGVNGAGKSTLQRALESHYQARGIEVVLSQEPGGTALGKQLRSLLLNASGEPRSPLAEALLFSADRAQHVEHLIQPAIQAGKLVLVDRYYYSTVAFQGYGRGYSIETLLSLSDIAIQMCKPDIVLLLDLDPAAGLKRNAEKEEEDRFELEEIEFHTKLRQGFLDLAKNLEEPFAVLDARRAPESILQEAVQYIDRVLASR